MFNIRLVVHLFFIGVVIAGVSETIYTATLTPSQVTGAYVSDNNGPSFGSCFCRIQRYNTYLMSCYIQHNVEELTNATLNIGARGVDGEPIANISIRTGFSLQFRYTIPSAQELQNVFDGLYYIQIYSHDYPNGEIRGQIEHRDRFYAYLLPQNTIPTSSGTDAHGVAVASYNAFTKEMDLDLVHDVTAPIATDFGIGQYGTRGFADASLPGNAPLFPVITLTSGEDEAAAQDLTFLNVRSQNNPQGDIRGQLISIDYIRDAAFTSLLVGDGSTAIGTAIFTYDCDTNSLEYVIYHTVENATSATIYELETGVVLHILSSGQSPIYGGVFMLDEEAAALYNFLLGVSVQSLFSNSNSTGEISGTINDDYKYYAYLSGTNVVPVVTTHYGGVILFAVGENDEGFAFDYQMIHTVRRPSEVVMLVGREGENSIYPPRFTFESPFSPSAEEIPLSDAEVNAIQADSMYVEVRTSEYPFGIIRGQIRRVNSCTLDQGTFSVGYDDTISIPNSYISALIQYWGGAFESSPASFTLPSFVCLFMLLLIHLL